MATFYRIAKSKPAGLEDFLSEYAMDRPPRGVDDNSLLFWFGISMWATEAQARRKAREWPLLGRYIAELDIPADRMFVRRRTLGQGHHTVWAYPARILGCAIRTFDV